jgi:hypothetical protein
MALEAVINAPKIARGRMVAAWGMFLMVAILGACLTPYGPRLFLTLGRVMGLGQALLLIVEWQPASFGHLSTLELALFAGLASALYLGVRLPPVRVLVLVGLLYMAFAHIRHASLLALVLPLLIADPLGKQFGRPQIDRPLPARLSICATLVALIAAFSVGFRDVSPADLNSTQAAVAAIRAATNGLILNDSQFGGYLIFSGIPPSADGRSDLYGEVFILEYYHALRDKSALTLLLNEHHIEATMMVSSTPAVSLLDQMPDWRRVYSDSLVTAHVRR